MKLHFGSPTPTSLPVHVFPPQRSSISPIRPLLPQRCLTWSRQPAHPLPVVWDVPLYSHEPPGRPRRTALPSGTHPRNRERAPQVAVSHTTEIRTVYLEPQSDQHAQSPPPPAGLVSLTLIILGISTCSSSLSCFSACVASDGAPPCQHSPRKHGRAQQGGQSGRARQAVCVRAHSWRSP